MKHITVLSLFDGISCARVALDLLGYTDVLYLASEIDKYAIQITQKNWPDTIQLGDVTQIRRENLPTHIDLLIGGSPCQDLSIAKNNRKGLDGERSGLFWEWVRLWQECQPRYWVLENVNSMPKEAKRIISETLGVEPIMINAALVSAQSRKRLFWTNIETDMFGNCHIPQPDDRGILLKHILETGQRTLEVEPFAIDHYNGNRIVPDNKAKVLGTNPQCLTAVAGQSIAEPVADAPIRVGDIGSTSQGQRVYSQDGKSVTLSAMGGGQGAKTGLYAIPEARGVALRSRTRHDNHAHEKYEKRPEITGEKATAMTSVQTDSMVATPALEGYTIRKLTPIECERLMTLPDGYTEGVSNTQRYKALGNGFVVEVVRHILSYMDKEIEQ